MAWRRWMVRCPEAVTSAGRSWQGAMERWMGRNGWDGMDDATVQGKAAGWMVRVDHDLIGGRRVNQMGRNVTGSHHDALRGRNRSRSGRRWLAKEYATVKSLCRLWGGQAMVMDEGGVTASECRGGEKW